MDNYLKKYTIVVQDLDIIYEDRDYIVVNKPSGLITERSPFERITVESLVYEHLLIHKPMPYLGVIHRLDRVTSGVLMFAKKKSILVLLNTMFSERKVQKTYYAIVESKPRERKETLKNYLFKNHKKKRAEIFNHKTKETTLCQLTYEVMGENSYGYLLKIKPKTGRYHQIRAQLSHIGSPIIGDEKYGSSQRYLPLSIALHAHSLKINSLNQKNDIYFEASFPPNEWWQF